MSVKEGELKDKLSFKFKNVEFNDYVNANFKKYFHPAYLGKNIVVEMFRKIEKNVLTIYRVHQTTHLFKKFYLTEKLVIDRENKTQVSTMSGFGMAEKCVIEEDKGEKNCLLYNQYYKVMFFLKGKKKEAFDKGCSVLEEILSGKNLN